MAPKSTLVIVQYAGDFAETYRSFERGAPETYYAQRHSVLGVAALAGPEHEVVTICCTAATDYDVTLAPGLRAIGVALTSAGVDPHRVCSAIQRCAPTHLVLRTPMHQVLAQATAHGMPTLVTIADSFNQTGLRARLRHWRLARLLNRRCVHAVANHGRTAARQLIDLGVQRSKVVAWDWPHALRPHDHPAKAAPIDRPWRLLFVGMLDESKGIGDVIRALSLLQAEHLPFELTVVGAGDQDAFERLAGEQGISKTVRFLGKRPHSEVIDLMRQADVALVPSRHEYPEGFPMTLYEALATRTPIVCSDHPMLVQVMADGQSALVFKAADTASLAAKLRGLMTNKSLHEQLSEQSLATWESLQLPIEWVAMVRTWYRGQEGDFLRMLDAGRKDLVKAADA